MTGQFLRRNRLPMIGIAIGAIGLGAFSAMAATPVAAQPYDPKYEIDGSTTLPDVTVTAPHAYGRSAIGAPIQLVSTSRVVQADDLDLTTEWGARALRHRIERAARDACDNLDAMHPITDENSPPCYESAVNHAMLDAESAVGFEPPGW